MTVCLHRLQIKCDDNDFLSCIDKLIYISKISLWTTASFLDQMRISKIEERSAYSRSNQQWCSVKKGVLRDFPKFIGKHMCHSLFFNKETATLLKKETLTQVFSCELYEIYIKTFFTEHLPTDASVFLNQWASLHCMSSLTTYYSSTFCNLT